MKRNLLHLAVLVAVVPFVGVSRTAAARPGAPTIRSKDFHANPTFFPIGGGRGGRGSVGGSADTGGGSMMKGGIAQVGEVVILEGDSDLVSDDGMGNYGVAYDMVNQDPLNITQRFFTRYKDEFDEVIVLTTFDDNGAAGALAYEISTHQDVLGLGDQVFDDDGAGGWGGDSHRLHAFVNMMRWDQFHSADGLDPTDPRSGFYSTLGQEFAHRWLSFLTYTDASGRPSDKMLGRDKAHWASTLQTDASVMDGNRWVDNSDGTFTDVETFSRYSQLDLYAMGLVDPATVPPWYLITQAVSTRNGTRIDPTRALQVGTKVRGTREDISMQQVVDANGPRVPAFADAPHSFRVAFVLLTRPGERAADVRGIAATVDGMRQQWERSFAEYTGGRGSMCTQVSAPCGAPVAKIVRGRIVENGGNHNGVVEPGEPVTISFTLSNDSPQTARPVAVKADGGSALTIASPMTTLAELPAAATSDVSFSGALSASAACGAPVEVNAESSVGPYSFVGLAELVPGLTDAVNEDFEKGAAYFGVDLDGKDTTHTNPWQYGQPVEYKGHSGWVFQPDGGHSGQRCWFTGLSEGHRPMTDSSVGVGTTTLWSPDYDLSTTYRPSLRYWAWFQAIDFTRPAQGGSTADGIYLTVEGSTDGGDTWKPVDKVDGAEPSWRLREVPLDPVLAGARSLRLRFTASAPMEKILVEAGLDDVEIRTLTPACNPDAVAAASAAAAGAGCGCTVADRRSGSGPDSGSALAALTLLALALVLRRRR